MSDDAPPPPEHVSRIRPVTADPIAYNIALRLHVNANLDSTYDPMDFAAIPGPILGRMLADLEARTGVASGAGIGHDVAADEET